MMRGLAPDVIWMIAGMVALLAAVTRVSVAGAPPDRHTARG